MAFKKWQIFSIGFLLVGVAVYDGLQISSLRGQETPSEMTDSKDLKTRLSSLQYQVTQEGGTEAPFQNAYWDNKRPGIYVDLISGEPLFSSLDKYDSGSGWPSFTKPISGSSLETKEDRSLGMSRTEVKGKHSNSHLGHVFSDGPGESGLRYCINSASLRFVPLEDLEKEGYGEYKKLFVLSDSKTPPKK